MSIQTTTRLTTLPRVNLLPPEIGERKRLQQVQAVAVVAVVAVVGAVAFLDVQGGHKVSDARSSVASAVSDNAALTRQLATYSDVTATASELAASKATLNQAMSTEVLWSGYLTDLSQILPANTWLTSLTLNEQLPAGSLTAPTQASGTVGRVTFQGVAMKYNDLAAWLDSLQPEAGIANVYFANASAGYIGDTSTVTFAATADLTSSALCQTPGGC